MEFKKFNKQIQKQFAKMCETKMLFRANVSGNELWDLYLSSFENEKIFRDPESSEHNCNCCKNFIRRYGNVITINPNGEIESIFSNIGNVGEYTLSAQALDDLIKSKAIGGVFFETYKELNENLNYESTKKNQEVYKLGIESNLKKYNQEEVEKFGVVNTTRIYEFNHFCINLPKQFVDFSGNSIEQITAKYKDKYSVFKRAMEEIPLDTLNLVRDLINQGSLLDGNAHLHSIEDTIAYVKLFNASKLPLELYCWQATYNMDERIAKFKNTLIGVLCTELAEGLELNKACENWNKRVDPVNYHKATAPITKKQIEEAKKFVEENGYVESFDRRLANIDDIKASEILHMNTGEGKIKEVSMFDSVKPTSTRHKRSEFKNIETISIDKFMSDVLPSCSSIEAYLENRMEGNLVALTTSKNSDSKQITKWNNIATNYSWTFNGNLAGKSQIKDAVKDAGGNVDGILNFRLAWNDSDGRDNSDLDAWAQEPNGTKIGYSTGFRKDQGHKRTSFSGQLDVDNTNPGGKLAVENITWIDSNKMRDGIYKLWVNQYSVNNSQGFKAEIEFNNEIYSYEYKKPLAHKENVLVAEVTLKNGEFIVNHKLAETNSSKELWNLETNNFYKVNLVCKSPNHWGENSVGNLHYFFMLDGCKTNKQTRGFHNENLLPELLKHKKVMEVLGATNMIEPTDKQLSGIGFNSTVKDELIVKCSGNFKRMLKIKF
jgi:hypothetical protein